MGFYTFYSPKSLRNSLQKTRFFAFAILLLLSAVSISCGKLTPKGTIVMKEMNVASFDKIEAKGKFRVFLVHASRDAVQVETYPNILDNLKINVDDGTLQIAERRPTQHVDFYNITIYAKKNPEQISVADSAEFNVSGEINTNLIRIFLKNNGKFIGSVRSKKAEVTMQDTSVANFKGFTEDVVMKITDTAGIIAPYWKIDHLRIDIRNGSYAEVNVEDSLKGAVQNTAKFTYYNNPVRAFEIGKKATVENKELE